MDNEPNIRFADITAPTPDRASLARDYAAINALFDDGEIAEAAARFDRLRREIGTWGALVELRFQQNTDDAGAKAALDYRDELLPAAQNHETAFKRRMLDHDDRTAIVHAVGANAVALWDLDIGIFRPEIEADLEQEAKLAARYTELTASVQIEIDGRTVNYEGMAPYREHIDRALRHEAEQKIDAFFGENAAELDQIYDELVKLRHGIARKLGYESFIPLAYKRMRRLDYGPDEVARYRDAIATHVTPLVAQIMERRRTIFGWDKVFAWDERIVDPLGNPTPLGGHDELVAAGQAMYDRMDPEIARFYEAMNQGGFLDLKNRPAKGNGGFCTSFDTVGMPFIFANFVGTSGDIDVLTHEMGHAFQYFSSRALPSVDDLWPGSETAEIHSMSFEFFAYPHAELLVGTDAAARYRQMHLIGALTFLPHGACLDHFQHEVYANPDMTPAERRAVWRKLERHYLPWRDYGDLANGADGGSWQQVLHLYLMPFYMIDYALAQCCALQFWTRSRKNYAVALADYIALCRRGGSAPFLELVASAGLISPFAPGALEASVAEVAKALRSD
ncbi:M3 family oligoendopeptidase [Acidiphilium sp. PA]|uniref:M3 family oligoendopeptidase n=1 Tax=Acidiphilium sp. PA TaxID=2871705 RepID=UPI002244B0DA|nr:M3 family oligoendopeptidase [Acidiphilium sp. PA]MCW8306296.1 M3 family oligoendopeptidase [Acidiphilium sp. PA]